MSVGRKAGRGSASATAVLGLYRGRQRLALIRDLAMGEWSAHELAEQIGVPASEVATFAAMHADEVSEVRAALAGELAIETAGLWLSKRHNRVAEYHYELEQLEQDVAVCKKVFGPGSKEHTNLLRTWAILMRNAADEYLPSRIDKADRDGEANVVHYVIEGDPDIVKALT